MKYFLAFGTLLGAVRHHGYIPWDDDIDIMMLREDYERLIREFNTDRTDHIRVLHHSIDPRFPYGFAKVHSTDTRLIEHTDYPYDIGVNIDVFVLDAVPEEKKKREKLVKKVQLPQTIMQWKLILDNRERGRSGIRALCVSAAKTAAGWFSMDFCTSRIDAAAIESDKSSSGKLVSGICGPAIFNKKFYRRCWLDHITELEFEGQMFMCPTHYDAFLTEWYGDYMTPPPENERVTHHDYKAYIL